MFPDLLLLLASLAPSFEDVGSDSDTPPATAPARVSGFLELIKGRLNIATLAGVEAYLGATPELDLAEAGHLELGATGRTILRWSGEGSISLTGKASMEWTGSPFSGSPAGLFDFDHVEVDARKGELGLRLPGGVLLIAKRAALELRQRSSGVFGVHHLGGEPAVLVIPAIGSPEKRELTAGQWTWIDPAVFVRRSRFGEVLARTEHDAGSQLDQLLQPEERPTKVVAAEQPPAENPKAGFEPFTVVLAPEASFPEPGGVVTWPADSIEPAGPVEENKVEAEAPRPAPAAPETKEATQLEVPSELSTEPLVEHPQPMPIGVPLIQWLPAVPPQVAPNAVNLGTSNEWVPLELPSETRLPAPAVLPSWKPILNVHPVSSPLELRRRW